MKICVFTYGCRVNRYESDAIARQLMERGHEVVSQLEFADVYVVNTCAVTREAERKSRQSISRIKKFNKGARILVCGCASQKNKDAFTRDGVTYVSGTSDKMAIVDMIEREGVGSFDISDEYEECKALSSRTKFYIKVQDGCNNFCAYCIIPYLRGRSRSRNIDDCIEEAISSNAPEIVLTGINLSAYGVDKGYTLTDLVDKLSLFQGRVSLGSLEVGVINDSFLTALKKLKRFCPHFHLSLQSGSDKVLKDMNRHYTREVYVKAVQLIKSYFKHPSITTDVIVGFPTESEEDFLDTINLCKEVEFSDVHVFPYSKREGTVAYKLGELDGKVVKDRVARLERVRDELRDEYKRKMIGESAEVLIEEIVEYPVGYSERYVRVYVKTDGKVGEVKKVKILGLYEDGIIAK